MSCLALSTEILLSGSFDKTIKLWAAKSPFGCINTYRESCWVKSLCMLSNEHFVCGLSSGQINKWSLSTFQMVDSFQTHENWVNDLKLVDSFGLASCSLDQSIKLLDVNTLECLKIFEGHSGGVNCLDFLLDEKKLFSASQDHTVKVWSLSTGRCLNTIDLESSVLCLALVSSSLLAVGLVGDEHNLKLVELNTDQVKSMRGGHHSSVLALKFDPSEKVLVSGSSDRTFKFWKF